VDSENKGASKNTSGLRPYPPGVSGNPGGRSPEREALRREAQNYLATQGLKHIKAIEDIAENAASEKVSLSARIWLAEQFVGKATQAITGADGAPLMQPIDFSRLSADELATLDRIRRRLAGE
jgi:hypothetical protein